MVKIIRQIGLSHPGMEKVNPEIKFSDLYININIVSPSDRGEGVW